MYNNLTGWDRKELNICNVLFNAITINKKCDKSKKMEIELKLRYTKIAGRLNENNNGDSENTDTYDSNVDNLEAYDGFAGGFQLSQAMSITQV